MGRYVKQKSQGLAEYAVILAIVAAALIAMQMYMKRGIQGAVKIAADRLGSQQIYLYHPREQTSSNTISFEDRYGWKNKRVFIGGGQRVDEDSRSRKSGTSSTLTITDSASH
jgi:Flp pilus assembly pilin Flp